MADRRAQLVEVFNDTVQFYREDPALRAAVAYGRVNTRFYDEDDYPEFPEELEEKTLSQLALKPKRDILVLMVEHADRTTENPTAKTVFHPGDRITVCGDYRKICQVFQARERFSDN